MIYNFENTDHKHAVASTSDGRSFVYDENGNMTTRNIPGGPYTLIYDWENRLASISSGTSTTARYVYDGDGQRVISIVGTTTTVYIGNLFEAEIGENDTPGNEPLKISECAYHCPSLPNKVFLPMVMQMAMMVTSGPQYHSHPANPPGGSNIKWRTYYYAAGQRVATRETTSAGMGDPYYLLSDHLGSTTVTVNKDGQRFGQIFYTAWGEIDADPSRTNGTTPTKRRYTGQYEADAGLLFYGARFYDPAASQFTQPDSLVPDPYNLLDWNRYLYARANPIRFTDPTGHDVDCAIGESDCKSRVKVEKAENLLTDIINSEEPVTWYSLSQEEKKILQDVGWDPTAFEHSDYVTSPLSDISGTTKDPAVWISLLPFLLRSPQILSAGLTACYTSSVCNNLFMGIQPYGEMPPQSGYERHHLIEQRFARILGVNPDSIPSVYLTPGEHDMITGLWRQLIGYRGDSTPITTVNATINVIWVAAQQVYANSPDLLVAVRIFLFGQ